MFADNFITGLGVIDTSPLSLRSHHVIEVSVKMTKWQRQYGTKKKLTTSKLPPALLMECETVVGASWDGLANKNIPGYI